MYTIYNVFVHIASFLLKGIALFNPKIKLFVTGRKSTFTYLQKNITSNDAIIWIHTASLGEFEQGLPIIEKLRSNYPNYKILVTFFSPSGYEIKKNTPVADYICYLPLDTIRNAEKFIQLTEPKLAVFIKYEIWPSYLKVLKSNEIPTLLTSAIFNPKQLFFKSYGSFMRKSLMNFTHLFVQDENSKQLLNSININNVSISGDTRFDRVSEILEQDNTLDFMTSFKGDSLCLIAGSTWPEDENILVKYINATKKPIKYVIAPHNIKTAHINDLATSISKKTILYSKIKEIDISSFDVLIIDTIGLLTKIYSYANIAYVGGGFATGLHNTLEPAVFGIPILIGPNYKGFKEAEDLVALKGILPITDTSDFNSHIEKLITVSDFLEITGQINTSYVDKNRGATKKIMNYIQSLEVLKIKQE